MRPRSRAVNPDASASKEEKLVTFPSGTWIKSGTRMVRQPILDYAKYNHATLGWDLGGPMIGLLFGETSVAVPVFRGEWRPEDELGEDPP